MDPVSAAAGALETRVLSMSLTDVRSSIASVQQVSSPTQSADVILQLSTAAQQLLKTHTS